MAHRQITEIGIRLIKRSEGFSSIRYLCPAKIWTLGFGHAIRKGEKWDSPTITITEEEATELLKQDVEFAERAVLRLIVVPLEDCQFDALVDFTYNLGSGSLQRSTLRSMLNRYEYYDAAMEFDKWIWGGGRRLPGLIKRRNAEKMLFLTGVLI